MSVWNHIIDQDRVVESLQKAAEAARVLYPIIGDCASEKNQVPSQAMSQAWLITGPAGSGRSEAARGFAAALQCTSTEEVGCGECQACKTALSDSHPDIEWVRTDKVILSIKEVTDLLGKAQQTPAVGRFRIIVIEDADRMVERTSNVLLKAIEEPPPQTIWILCTLQADSLLPTIRSRCRLLTLKTPSAELIADYFSEAQGADYQQCLAIARGFHSHIGKIKSFLSDSGALEKRREFLQQTLNFHNLAEAIRFAERLESETKAGTGKGAAGKSANEALNQELAEQKIALAAKLGVPNPDQPPREYATMFKQLEEDFERKRKRSQRDDLDRYFLDLSGVLRDIYMLQLKADVPLLNPDLADIIRDIAQETSVETTLSRIQAITDAGDRLRLNGSVRLVLSALLAKFVREG